MDLDLYLWHVARFPVFLIAADPRVSSDGIEIAVSRHIDRSRIQIVVGLHIGTHLDDTEVIGVLVSFFTAARAVPEAPGITAVSKPHARTAAAARLNLRNISCPPVCYGIQIPSGLM